MIDNKKLSGVIGVVMLLVGFGGSQFLTAGQIEKAYVCPLTGDLVMFDRLSSTGKTGYYLEDGGETSVACRSGNTYEPWMPLAEYAESQGVSVNEFLEEISGIAEKAEVCGREGCFMCSTPIEAYGRCEGTMNYVAEILLPG